jgi:protein-disulfide isomerase
MKTKTLYSCLKAGVTALGVLLVLTSVGFAQINDKQFSEAMVKYLASQDGQKALGKTVEDYFQSRQAEMVKEREQKEKAEFEDQFKNPVKIEAGNAPVKGNPSAKITIIEFSDFQCPYCKRGYETMEKVLEAYPNDVKVAFKQLPLDFHKEATPAAKASLAAHKQGKFWEYHAELFKNQGKLGSAYYDELAKTLGLNVDKFKKDKASPEIEKQVKEDAALGAQHGIQGTPGFFVNGIAVKGAYPVEHFKMIIDKLLAKPS